MIVTEASPASQAEWDAFVRAAPGGSFLQSWGWGEFQRAAGFPITRLMARNGVSSHHSQLTTHRSDIQGVCLCIRRPLPLRRFSLYAPWGPVLRGDLSMGDMIAVLMALAGAFRAHLQGGGVFARVEPKLPEESGITHALNAAGFTRSVRSIQPKDTRVLDLTQSEDDLLRAMHPKTRYNIRLARRHGAVVAEETTPRGLRIFFALASEVARRERFRYHPNHYYETLLQTLAPLAMLTVLIARHQDLPLAGSLLVHFGDTVTYAYGASSSRRKHVMAPHLLHWESILRAKAEGAARYDFFGVAPPGASVVHPWFGISRFKQGFGGVAEQYVGAADLIADAALYRAVEIGRSLRALLR
ncbi:MAG: methicillin resistance protein [Parcubacteria group bacterium Gr01-1014_38]|nr:MAG: methicillin resistance protein [Parcubacteria group bacterium Gr01-1014_38]